MLYCCFSGIRMYVCMYFFLLIRYYTNIHILILYTHSSKYYFFDDLPVAIIYTFNRQSVYLCLIFLLRI